MDEITKIIVAAVLAFICGFALKFVGPKARIVWWTSHFFTFNLVDPKVTLLTHSITIQNTGRKRAEQIDITHAAKPDFFMLNPALDFEEITTPSGDHIIRIEGLSPREFFSIEFMSYKTMPSFLHIRSKAGYAVSIQIQPQQLWPRWVRNILSLFLLIGVGFSIYWLIRAVVFISSNY